MSKLTDDLEAEMAPKEICKVCRIIDSLDPEDSTHIKAALLASPLEAVSRVLTKNGHPISGAALKRHLNKGHQ